ncbi:MAG: TA system VapC family ribonuclease toxin [Actinomycetes bacterium]
MAATVDVNVLVHASDASSAQHGPARDLVHRMLSGPELFTLFWPVLLGYVRIVTHSGIFARPLPLDDAMGAVQALLDAPAVRVLGEGERFWQEYRRLGEHVPARGNQVPDAVIVALMNEYGVRTIYSRDRDFRRYAHILVIDPFE